MRGCQGGSAPAGGWERGLRAASLALTLAALLCVPAVAAPEPERFRANDAGGFRNILPPGQNGHASAADIERFLASGDRPPHNDDQLRRYEKLVFASPRLRTGQIRRFFKDASFGVRKGAVEHEYSPRGDVTILRDSRFGVPHVYGETRAGAMFGAGYVGAEDRLFMMDVLRHLGRAQLSSFIGGSEGNRQMDREQWSIAPYTEADLRRQFQRADELYGAEGRQVQQDVRNYVAGINRYIREAKGQTPPTPGAKNGQTPEQKMPGAYEAISPNGLPQEEPKPRRWRVTDLIATASLVGGIFGKGGGRELDAALILQAAQARFGDEDGRAVFDDFRSAEDPEAPTTVSGSFPYRVPPEEVSEDSEAMPDPDTLEETAVVASSGGPSDLPGGILDGFPSFPSGGSNALLVAGSESESGIPVAVFGPQTGYFTPQILMEIDIHAPATRRGPAIDARGAAFPGVNLYVQLLRGRDYAVSATSASQDNVDTFALELCEPDGEGEPTLESEGYMYRGECRPFEVLERTNRWVPNAADQTPAGSETLVARRTELGIEVARAEVGGEPTVYAKLRSTYMHEADSARGFLDFNDPAKMENGREFQRAASKINFTFNWFYTSGSEIAYFNSGDNPERPPGSDPSFPVRACPDDSDDRCKYEWRDWDPADFTADYTPFAEHPQAIDPPQGYLTSWNNKQAPDYRAADDNFAWGPVHRSEPLDDRIRPRIRGSRRITPAELIDAMEDAGTVDLRGDKVLPFALRLIDDPGPGLADAVEKLRRWQEAGAHRRDRNGDGVYEHSQAIKIMDAWWPRWIEQQFEPVLGETLYGSIVDMIGLDNEPNNGGDHTGSAYIAGWYGYAEKDLRAILGESPRGAYSREYCGDGDRSACRQILLATLREAVEANRAAVYEDPGGVCDDEQLDAQYCFDAIRHTPLGAITQPLIHWVNRPTFQQVVEVGATGPGNGGGSGPAPSPRDGRSGGPEGHPGRARGEAGGREPSGPVGPGAAAQFGGDQGPLPFTGLGLAAIALLGALLAGGGVAARRAARR